MEFIQNKEQCVFMCMSVFVCMYIHTHKYVCVSKAKSLHECLAFPAQSCSYNTRSYRNDGQAAVGDVRMPQSTLWSRSLPEKKGKSMRQVRMLQSAMQSAPLPKKNFH
jgi:hypothetical protein